MNKKQAFPQHHITRALKAASAAGVINPSVEVRLPGGATITVGGKPDKAAPVSPAAKANKPLVTARGRK
jgi:hypothetical protein